MKSVSRFQRSFARIACGVGHRGPRDAFANGEEELMTTRRSSVVASIAVGALAWMATAARAQEPQSLIYAVYEDENGAMKAYKSLQEAQKQQSVKMESYAVVSKDAKGKVHVQRSNQKKGSIAGAVIGGLIGALAGPAGAAVGAATGGLVGHATGEVTGVPREDIKAIKDTLSPGNSALVAVVDERWASDLSRSMQQTEARRVLQTKIAPSQPDTMPPRDTPQNTMPEQPQQPQQP
jgi:uncharacterized membrane protein